MICGIHWRVDVPVEQYCGRGIRNQPIRCLRDSFLEHICPGLGSWWFLMELLNYVSILIVRDGASLVVCPCGLHMRNHHLIRCGISGSIRNIGRTHRRPYSAAGLEMLYVADYFIVRSVGNVGILCLQLYWGCASC